MARLKNVAKIRRLVRARERALDRGKLEYGRADKLLEELLAVGWQPGQPVSLPAGRVAELEDQFAEKAKVFKPCGISRYTVKITAG